jgi:hypothetical protein
MAYTTITDPSAYSTITLYTGNGQDNRAVTNSAHSGNFKPDWLWIKERSSTSSHRLFDTSRGASKRIESNTNLAEATDTSNQKSFDTNGFTLGTSGSVNANNDTYVSWQWKSNGGTTASNSDGSITSTVQANTASGFSIVSYTANETNGATVGHGLGAAPEIIFIKGLDDNHAWIVGATPDSSNLSKVMILNNTDVSTTDANSFNNTAPTSSVFTLGTAGGTNKNGQDYISYLFRSIQGYSKIGVYTGNGSTDGSFIYTGFKPRFFMLKGTGNVSSWCMYDTARDPINRASQKIWANEANAEMSTGAMDFLSNGIKMRINDNDFNGDGNSYLYMAFAENPFVGTNGVPTTAK